MLVKFQVLLKRQDRQNEGTEERDEFDTNNKGEIK